MTPVIAVTNSPARSSLELDSSLRVQRIRLDSKRGSAPLAGFEVTLPPVEQPAWLFLWSAELQTAYSPAADQGLRVRVEPPGGNRWASVQSPEIGEGGSSKTSRGEVVGRRIAASRLDLQVQWDGSGPGVVEIHDAWWPGWKAWVNGSPTEVLPSGPDGGGLWRQVPITPGKSEVVLRYTPPLLQISLSLAASGFLLLLLSGWIADRKSARPAEPKGAPPSNPSF
jgi:hypothetical protein